MLLLSALLYHFEFSWMCPWICQSTPVCGSYSHQDANLATKAVALTLSGLIFLIPVSQAVAATPVVVASQVRDLPLMHIV